MHAQTDYLGFLAGLMMLLAAVSATALARVRPGRMRWSRLGAFAMLLGMVEWLRVFADRAAPDSMSGPAARVAEICAWLILFHFARPAVSGRAATWWKLVALLLGLAALLLAITPLGRWRTAYTLAAGLPAVWELSRCRIRSERRGLGVTVAMWALLALVAIEAWFAPAPAASPAAAALTVLAGLLLGLGLWLRYEAARAQRLLGQPGPERGLQPQWIVAAMAVLLLLGWLRTEQVGQHSMVREREQMLRATLAGALLFDPGQVARFAADLRDDTPDFAALQSSLRRLRSTDPSLKFVYLMAERDGRIIFLADAEDPASEDYSPPGQVYEEAAEQFEVLRDARAMVVGPYTDRFGTFVSALAPIVDAGRAVALLGQDVEASVLLQEVAAARRSVMALVLVCSLVLALALLAQAPADEVADRRQTMEGIVNEGPVVLCSWRVGGPTWLLELVSPNITALTGHESERFLAQGLSWQDIIHPDDRDAAVLEAAEAVRTRRGSWSQEYRLITSVGEVRTVQSWSRLVAGSDGAPALVNTLTVDVTDSRAAMAALERREQILTAVAEFAAALLTGEDWQAVLARALPGLAAPTGADSAMLVRFRCAEDAVARAEWIAGWTRLGPLRHRGDDAFGDEGVEAAGFGPLQAAMQAGQAMVGEVESICEPTRTALRERGVVWLASIPVRVGSTTWGALAFFRDSAGPGWTEAETAAVQTAASLIGSAIARREVEERLAGSEAHWSAMVDAMDEMVVTHKLVRDGAGAAVDYRVLAVNQAFCRITGISAEQAVGALASALYGTGEAPYREIYRTVAESGLADRFETYHEPMDKHFSISVVPLGPDQFATITNDVTGLRQSQRERQQMDRQLQHVQRLESLGVLAGGIAHDFNNLLTSILGHADLALSDLPALSPARPSLEAITESSRLAAELCTQMLAYAGKGRFEVEPVDVSELVQAMTHILEVSLAKRVVIRYLLEPHLPLVEADPSQLRQVIMNLVINAAEAIGERSGVVSVRTGAMDCDPAYLASTWITEPLSEGQFVFVEVSDTGVGMDAETKARAFDPFFTTKFTGRGLGLAATLGIVSGHRGAIRVYSEPGQGSTFRVLLPAAVATPAAETVPRPWRGSGSVLLVDDEETVRSVGRHMLQRLGFKPLIAADGVEALEVFRAHQDDIRCVILDFTMPRMNGEETVRALRRLAPEVIVIMTSGYSEEEVSSRFVGRGLAGFIQKPYQLGILGAKLREVLG